MNTLAAKVLYEMEYGRDTVLAVIIRHEDSAPRKSGSFMLIGKSGHLLGTIGGGAVEKRSEEMALQCLTEKRSAVHDFHLKPNSTEDIGMVCGGDVTVLFQYIPGEDENWRNAMAAVSDMYLQRMNGWLILDIQGSAPLIADQWGHIVSGGADTVNLPDRNEAVTISEQFFMPVNTGERAVIFGAGHCGLALAPILASVGFRVVIFDNRREFTDPALFPEAEQVICGDYEKTGESLKLGRDDYVVIMTSGHAFDGAVEKQVLAEETAYVGVIGSSKKIAAVNRRLMDAGVSEEKLKEVYTPIGLNIRAVTPQEIAVSIAAEMIRVRANRRDGIPDHPPENKKVH